MHSQNNENVANSSIEERVNGFNSEVSNSIQNNNRIVDIEEGTTNDPAMIVTNNKRRKLRDPKRKKVNLNIKPHSNTNDSYLWFNKVMPVTSLSSQNKYDNGSNFKHRI